METSRSDDLRVAIIGAGPAGLYTADALLSHDDLPGIAVDLVDRLPTPFGLVRYGVAPDHLSIRSVRDTLDRILDHPRLRFFGGVTIDGDGDGDGDGIPLDTLRRSYDAVFLTYGAETDRPLSIPGEDLPGSISATQFVQWYTGHPDSPPDQFPELIGRSRRVAVIGVGNVAVDVVRILAKTRAELEHTDMPEHVLTALDASSIEDIYLMGRRGPAEASWTTKELRELGELEGARVRVDPLDLTLSPSSAARVASSKVAARNVAVVEEWSARDVVNSSRSIHVRFYSKPVRIEGDADGVRSLVIERTALADSGDVVATEQFESIPVDLVIRSVGYRGLGLAGVPYDDERGVIPHDLGRVMGADGPVSGLYTAGWIKRGPSGIIGTNKKDAVETVGSFLADLDAGAVPRRQDDADPLDQFSGPVVDTQGWRRIDAAEKELGSQRQRARTTIHDRHQAVTIGARER